MYRYSPPKSSIWGHSLRKMEPAKQRALFDEFLKKAVAAYSFTGGSLRLLVGAAPGFLPVEMQGTWGHVTSEDVRRIEQLLGATALEGAFYSLTPQQCDAALDEINRNRGMIPGIMLTQGVTISQWLIHGRPTATQSMINLFYGMKPCISTFLQFETVEQFEFIRQVLEELHFCKLSEKHLKPMKRAAKGKSSGG